MTRSRRTSLLFALLLSAGAFAGVWVDGTPGVRAPVRVADGNHTTVRSSSLSGSRAPVRSRAHHPAPPAPRISAPIAAIHALDLDGLATEIPVSPGLDLCQPLPLPEGIFAELVVELAGPVAVSTGGRKIRALNLDTLTVALEDPDEAAEAGAVVLDLRGLETDTNLEATLRDGLVGVAP